MIAVAVDVYNCRCTQGPVMSTAFQLNTFVLFLFFVSKTQAVLLKTLEHGVEGDVKIEGDTIVVENFSYDGNAPAAYFIVGTSGCPSEAGIQLEDKPLREHSGQKLPLELPNNIRAGDLIWGVRCLYVHVMQVT